MPTNKSNFFCYIANFLQVLNFGFIAKKMKLQNKRNGPLMHLSGDFLIGVPPPQTYSYSKGRRLSFVFNPKFICIPALRLAGWWHALSIVYIAPSWLFKQWQQLFFVDIASQRIRFFFIATLCYRPTLDVYYGIGTEISIFL